MLWFRKKRRLMESPTTIAESLHRIVAGKPTAPETFHLPDDCLVRTRFREKVLLYQEATVLLALVSRVKPSPDGIGQDPLFEPVLREYERIIFAESSVTSGSTRREFVSVAFKDLAGRIDHSLPESQRSAWGSSGAEIGFRILAFTKQILGGFWSYLRGGRTTVPWSKRAWTP